MDLTERSCSGDRGNVVGRDKRHHSNQIPLDQSGNVKMMTCSFDDVIGLHLWQHLRLSSLVKVQGGENRLGDDGEKSILKGQSAETCRSFLGASR